MPSNCQSLTLRLEKSGLSHRRFGELTRLDAVRLEPSGLDFSFSEFEPTLVHLTVTGRCQARCKGCINAAIAVPCRADGKKTPPVADTVPERDAAAIVNLLRHHPDREGVVCFYGGEPLLAPDSILRIMDDIATAEPGRPVRYMLYTNGDLLEKVAATHPELIERLWLISVSIDGRRDQHEAVRIGLSLDRIHRGLAALPPRFPGTVLMWSTLREEQSLADCFAEFMTLHEQGLVRQFFWHWEETATEFNDLAAYAERYEKDFSAVLDLYLEHLNRGDILPLVHVNELVLYALSGKARGSSACGVELEGNYDLIDGRIHACADLPIELAIGSIDPTGNLVMTPHDLLPLVAYKDDLGCYRCTIHSYCGGRCPVQARIGTPLRLVQYCQLMRLHVGLVLERLDEIIAAIDRHGLTAQQFYDGSAMFAQFTDVTP